MVYTILDAEMKGGIHALSIVAKTPSEADAV
jgi:stress-induced morphogen